MVGVVGLAPHHYPDKLVMWYILLHGKTFVNNFSKKLFYLFLPLYGQLSTSHHFPHRPLGRGWNKSLA